MGGTSGCRMTSALPCRLWDMDGLTRKGMASPDFAQALIPMNGKKNDVRDSIARIYKLDSLNFH